ncbi:MAG: CRTAC1 family protein [Planctomycetota bacterium]|jgi:hypothetical protein
MTSTSLRKGGVCLAFGGLLACSWWLDQRDTGTAETGEAARFGFRLREVASECGIDFRHHAPTLDPKIANVEPHVAALGASVSVADADGDGWPDLYVTNSAFGRPNALYRNRGDATADAPGSFEDVAAAAGVADCNREGEGVSMGSFWADMDNDGDEDLFVTKWGYSQLFRNEGGLRFTDVTQEAGLRRRMNANAAVWFDYDRDGFVDLYVAGYFPARFDLWQLETTKIMHESFEFALNGGHNVLWRNLGDGRFEDVTERTGCDSTRWTLAVAAADFDSDGWQDLYLANDYGPEELFRNVEGKRFEIAEVGLGEDSKSGMAVAIGDVTDRGEPGVFVTNISEDAYLFQGNNLRLNLLAEAGRFQNVAKGNVANCGWAWGAQFGDFDNDGRADLYVANGFVSADPDENYWYDMTKVSNAAGALFQDTRNWAPIGTRSLSGHQRSRVLLNRGSGRFLDVAEAVGVDDTQDGRAVALADLWRRGVQDVIVANQKGPLLIYRNEPSADAHWIAFELRATTSNRSAIGARVTLYTGDARQVRIVDGGSGFCSQNERRLHFGLGASTAIDKAVVRWPSGRTQELAAPPLDRLHVLTEPE